VRGSPCPSRDDGSHCNPRSASDERTALLPPENRNPSGLSLVSTWSRQRDSNSRLFPWSGPLFHLSYVGIAWARLPHVVTSLAGAVLISPSSSRFYPASSPFPARQSGPFSFVGVILDAFRARQEPLNPCRALLCHQTGLGLRPYQSCLREDRIRELSTSYVSRLLLWLCNRFAFQAKCNLTEDVLDMQPRNLLGHKILHASIGVRWCY
jgi:hypothetical protein